MNLKDMIPLVIYDDRCYLCIKFAKVVNFLAGGKLSLIGHYSSIGEKLRSEILDSSALEMFWFVDGVTAYGGRAALIPLFKSMISSKKSNVNNSHIEETCDAECKTPKAVFIRSSSLLSNSKKIILDDRNFS